MVLPVSQSLLVQLVPAVCLDYVPGVSSQFYLFLVCSATCFLSVVERLPMCPCVSYVCGSLKPLCVIFLVSFVPGS